LDAVRALLEAPPGNFAADESSQGNPVHGRVEACWSYALDCVAGVGHHPLIAAAHVAFSQHRPLVLSPDVIWVTIVQGFAQHVRLNPETHRAFLVRHEGKRELTVKRDDLHRGSPENPWTEVVAEFALQLHREIGEPAARFVCDFSTTGPVERTVSEVALLDVLQPYFSYNVVCICGIPSITLEGTPADWRNLREKVDLMAPFGLDWWLSELRSICDQFARAAAGDIDRQHWSRLYKVRAVYGAEVINGWLGKLFPYIKDLATGKFSRRNDLLDPEVEAEIRKLEAEEARGRWKDTGFNAPGISADSLPRGLSQVPFTLTDRDGTKSAMEFLAGPIVVTQNGETGSLRPTLGWAVRESPPIEQALIRLSEHRLEPPRGGLSWKALSAFGYYVPTDVLRFYHEAGGASIYDENRLPLFRVLPLAEWTEPEWVHKGRTHPPPATGGVMASLLVLRGMNPGQRIKLTEDTVVLGRNPDCQVPIGGTAAARKHAQILHIQGKHYIEDLNSRGGTYVNKVRVTSRLQLNDNDRIQICDFLCMFHEPRRNKMLEPSELLRFAETSDGTELIIRLHCPERGAVFVGRRRDGESVAETGQKVALSFTDFLLRALDSGSEPYFRRAGFMPLPVPPATASLVVLSGMNSGKRIKLTEDTVVLGRNPDCQVPIESTAAASKHAQILHIQGKHYIEDLNSRGGTYVNKVRVRSRLQLNHGDRIQICDFQCGFLKPAAWPLPHELSPGEPKPSDDPAASASGPPVNSG
jgi:pSer/pThr/pTyr-binding forkhead associated (FHA) protein